MSDDRKDLPPVSSPNFLEKLREAVQVYLGNRGDKLDRGLTVRDLAEAGLIDVNPMYVRNGGRVPPVAGPGEVIEPVYEPDLTPPPTPSGFYGSAGISTLFVGHDAATYTTGNGHARTVLYGATWTSGPVPVFANAVPLAEFQGTVYAYATNPSTTWHLWIKWKSVDGVESLVPVGGTNGLVLTTGQDVSLLVEAMTGPGNPFTVLATDTVIDGVTFPAGTYSTKAFVQDLQVTNAKIANLAVDDAKIANLSVAKLEAGSLKVGSYIQSADYTPGAGGVGYRIDRDAVVLPATSIRGTLTAAQINSNGLDVKDSAGNVILSAGSSLAAQMASRMGGGNMVPNSDLSGGAGNWAVTWNQGGGTNYSFGVDVGGVDWSPAGGHSVSVARTGATGAASGIFDIRPAKTIPARPNTRYELSAYLSAHRCPAGFSIMVLDSAGSYITELYYAITTEGNGGKDLNNWSRPGGFYTTPANATQFHIGLRAGAATAADPYAWMTRMFIAEAGANQTVLSPWSAGGSSGQFGELDKLTSANVSTYIASAAIGEAYIGDLNASKITAGTIAADRLDSGTVTAKVANLSAAVITSGTIGSARIGDASIGTLKLGENSATICKSQSGTSGYVDVVFTIGYAADVLVVGSGVNSSAYNFGLQMNGSWITGVELAQGLITMSAKVTLAAGTHTASVRCDGRSGTISIFASIR